MSVFSDAELTYLAQGKLGRLATIDGAGMPHVVPLGRRYNPELDTIDIGGRDFARTRKFRNAQHNPNVALVVDDVLPPWRPRCVLIRGRAEALADAAGPDGEPAGPVIRLHPAEVIKLGNGVRRGIAVQPSRRPRRPQSSTDEPVRCRGAAVTHPRPQRQMRMFARDTAIYRYTAWPAEPDDAGTAS